MEVETINPETINSHQPNIEQIKPSIGLPPILKPPKHQAYPGKATIRLIQQMSSGADIFNKRALFSIRQTHNNKKYLQQYEKEHNRQRSETQLDVSNQKNHKKHPIFLSAKNNKLKLPKPVVVNNNLKTLKEQFKLREESIERFLTNPQVLQKYKMLSHLGKGSFSIVSLAINKESNQRFAIKTYAKVDEIEDYKFDNIYKEINHLAVLAHQNIVCLYHVIKDKRKILLIMQDGGKLSLAGLLRKNKTISQIQAKSIFKQILIGIKYCHDNKICHRDIKLENILINDHNIIKIIDFGFSSKCGVKLQNYCGTPPYMAPEITYKVPYFGQPADMWALGILLYLMLHGKFPFRANSQKQLYRLIQQGKLQFGQGISIQAKQIITKLLKCNLHDRLTAQKAMQIAWLN